MYEIKIGDVVLSTAGRDKDKYFMVFEVVNDKFVFLVDGKFRLIDKPKLKKIKHIKNIEKNLTNIAIKLSENKVVFDKEILKALKNAISEVSVEVENV